MKRYVFVFATALLFAFVGMSCSQQSEDATAETETAETEASEAKEPVVANASFTMKVEGMGCSKSCPATIRKGLMKMAGIESVEVDYDTKACIVKYDNTVANEGSMIEKVNELHDGMYTASPFEADAQEAVEADTEADEAS